MPAPILTDGATFMCAHGGIGTVAPDGLATQVTVGGHRPVLAGARVTGFASCLFPGPNGTLPCVGYRLPPPQGKAMTIGGQAVYTTADAGAIALAMSEGNKQPGLSVIETQSLLLA